MKRYFIETNGYNCIAFVDSDNKAIVFDEICFDETLTIEYVKKADFSNLDGCETAQECINAIGGESNNITLVDNFDDEFTNSEDVTITEF